MNGYDHNTGFPHTLNQNRTLQPLSKGRVDNVGINVSLFHLAEVIMALHKKAKDKSRHVPYRNSMLTSILKVTFMRWQLLITR